MICQTIAVWLATLNTGSMYMYFVACLLWISRTRNTCSSVCYYRSCDGFAVPSWTLTIFVRTQRFQFTLRCWQSLSSAFTLVVRCNKEEIYAMSSPILWGKKQSWTGTWINLGGYSDCQTPNECGVNLDSVQLNWFQNLLLPLLVFITCQACCTFATYSNVCYMYAGLCLVYDGRVSFF